MSLQGKTLFITGASRGIGREIALRAARDGANIVIAAKSAEPHAKLPGTIFSVAEEVQAAGGKALALQVDVRDEDAVRAALARAIVMDPRLLFFDEPSAGLDPVVSAELDELILLLRDVMNMTIVVVTHELESAFKIADRITKETHRGVTVLDGIGWYSKRNVKVLVVLAYKRQSVEIFRLVKDIDPNAFISQSSVIGVYGEGFDKLKGK